MRLDRYLKVFRLIKRRTVANGVCDAGRVMVNGKVARISYEVEEGDVLELQLGARSLKVCVAWASGYAPRGGVPEACEAVS